MPPAPPALLARFQPWRRVFEIGFWVAVLGLQVVFNSVVSWIDLRRLQPGFPFWQPLAWEVTSTLVVGALVPAVVAMERRFPLHWDVLRTHLPLHLAASVAFTAVHVLGMVALRQALYAALGEPARPVDWGRMLVYEYLKDVRSYALILVAVVSYRLVLLRLQGEARVLDAPEPPAARLDRGDGPAEARPDPAVQPSAGKLGEAQSAPPPPAPAAEGTLPAADDRAVAARPERFLVRKLRREFLIAAADIAWVQAQGNYVGLHVNGHDYLLRSTLADFHARLDPARFVRVHRSHVVNLDAIREIEPLESGDAKLHMKDGSEVPCSRRYREGLGR